MREKRIFEHKNTPAGGIRPVRFLCPGFSGNALCLFISCLSACRGVFEFLGNGHLVHGVEALKGHRKVHGIQADAA